MKQVVILAGGKGTRLQERLGDLPKPMISIGGKPLLEHQVELAKAFGFTDIVIFSCYKPELIEAHLGDGKQEKPYLHVGELIDAMIHLFQKTNDRLNYFNIAPPDSATTVRYIAEASVRAAAPGAKIRYTGGAKGWIGDVAKFTYSIEKLTAAGWSPRLTSNEAVDLAIKENLGNLI